jgi:Protein of unknown function (DUF3105)
VRKFLGWVLVVVVSLAIVIAVVLLLQSRDEGDVGGATGPGEKVAARCPDRAQSITHDARPLSENQVKQAVSLGNVVLRYHGSKPPAALRALQDQLTGPFDAEIAAAGQAVILAGGGQTVEALAWGRRLRARTPDDPQLRTFAEAWLGEGAPKPCS